MENAISRNVRAIEARIRKGIILTTPKQVAKAVGVHESQITRWQAENGFIEKAARLLDAIGFDAPVQDVIIQGDEARALIQMLAHIKAPKRKAPAVTEASQQMDLTI